LVYPRWWANQQLGNDVEGLSVFDLISSGTLDYKLASLLWILMEHRSSVLVAAGPAWAGKTTLLNALLDFLPFDLQRIPLQGYFEDFRFLNYTKPEKTYLIAEEISNHGFAEYLWGDKAIKTLNLLPRGYHLGSTMHARNSEEAIYVLHKYLGLPLSALTQLGIIINLRATTGKRDEDEPIRRIISVDLILPAQEKLMIQVLAARQFTEEGFSYLGDKDLQRVLADKYFIGKYCITAEMDTRMRFLKHLIRTGKSSRKEIREAITEYHQSALE
jgi:hypothetical protein